MTYPAKTGQLVFVALSKHQTTTDLTMATGNLAAWLNTRRDPSGLISGDQ
jgi:hypothetical protein